MSQGTQSHSSSRTAVRSRGRTPVRRSSGVAAALRELRGTFRGPLHAAGDAAYDGQRATWDGALDAHPAIVAEAIRPQDVRAAVDAARDHGLPLAVQSTGHGTLTAADGALLLKTGRMSEVSIDHEWEIARVGAGATWADVIAAAEPYGLVPVSGDHASVGVAGFTLGGGVGWLSRKYGLAADNLLRAEVVTAGGRLVAASATRHSDLFWALCGGGANFGAVTALELRLHRVPRVHAGVLWFPLARAAATLAGYRTWALAQPRELTTSIVLKANAADVGIAGPAMGVRVLYAGDQRDAERALRSLWAVTGAPFAGSLRTTTYEWATVGGTAPRGFELLPDLPDALIAAAIGLVTGDGSAAAAAGFDADARATSAAAIGLVTGGGRPAADAVEIRCWDGAIADAGPDPGPAAHRGVPFSVKVDGPPEAPQALAPHATGGSFLNFLRDQSRTADAYTPEHWQRLRTLKRALDPQGLFGQSHRIPPADR